MYDLVSYRSSERDVISILARRYTRRATFSCWECVLDYQWLRYRWLIRMPRDLSEPPPSLFLDWLRCLGYVRTIGNPLSQDDITLMWASGAEVPHAGLWLTGQRFLHAVPGRGLLVSSQASVLARKDVRYDHWRPIEPKTDVCLLIGDRYVTEHQAVQ